MLCVCLCYKWFYSVYRISCSVRMNVFWQSRSKQDLYPLPQQEASFLNWEFSTINSNLTAWSNNSRTWGVTIPTSNPVNSYAFHSTDACSYDVFPPGLITFGARYSIQPHVCPVHCVISCKLHHTVNGKRKWDDEWCCHRSIYALK